ncbi:MAG: type II toxin-antitoxin system RelE/ParE family toxin [Candidatus Zixiibacteriota bacterium]
MYEILIERTAERDFKRLPPKDFDLIVPHIKALGIEPRPQGCRKLLGSKNDWRIRVGDYRVIYEIHDQAKEIRVMKIRHRREVYR